ncbi:leucine-rich repeat domain-containing protein [Nocardioides sp. W3-2-3]|uniref:hypothetical protein n=1 Tax=Nocardioides convexus TaxID=2712224 RepID=UPI0024189616|nr:hypothetical protein [Nocardioides convexus]NGZ99607.1 leucine-rich repeat domain-containing protein [Nocardioides convexus]
MTQADYEWLGSWFQDHPHKELRAYGGYDGSITDLDFLRFFPTLRRFRADRLDISLTSIEGLRYLPADAVSLGIGKTKRRVSLAPLARFTRLEHLSLEAQTKDIEVVAELTTLRSVTLRSMTLPDLSVLAPLIRLRALHLKPGRHDGPDQAA